MPNVSAQLGDAIELATDPYAAADGADALVLVTEWHELRHPDFERLADDDARRACCSTAATCGPADDARGAGFTYYGIGRR